MRHHVERLAGGLALGGVFWLAWITPDEAVVLLLAAAKRPTVWLGAGAAAFALLAAMVLWRALRLLVVRHSAARWARLRA